ncbi:AbrB/MazE/SpoVT family DNA-binding domain-containing protein [Paralysiella testudinis]|uniref:AbrB/MazE/SpoVT family DNA-binding domain-containing protein n=1 Tax=Paralysiella testudinis TaxID=2809020 RepID=A0A892ZH71_9NEIS|nr:AbrB/MazE/SpoVT family DNA-binding domain-containing protein [Paralysiella testudinis]QRQ82875.1 AbrB/MazE/SpoVT family DNA-binding domain-containing protein [Paralysiella testudinis]
MATALKLTAKGQVTLRKEYLQHLGVSLGDQLDVIKLPNGELKIKAKKQGLAIDDIIGLLPAKPGKNFSIEEIDVAIANAHVAAGMKGLDK